MTAGSHLAGGDTSDLGRGEPGRGGRGVQSHRE